MQPRDLEHHRPVVEERGQDHLSQRGVLHELRVLVGGQTAGAGEDLVRNSDLAHVVQHSRQHDFFDLRFSEPHLSRDEPGVHRHPVRVTAGILVFGPDRIAERRDFSRSAAAPTCLNHFDPVTVGAGCCRNATIQHDH
jgi:hypothetical protein